MKSIMMEPVPENGFQNISRTKRIGKEDKKTAQEKFLSGISYGRSA